MTLQPEPDTSGWPPGLREVAEIIGAAATGQLVEHLRGREVYVPQPDFITGAHTLARALGPGAARQLAEHFGGQRLSVPTLRALASKKALIAAATGTDNEVAARYGVSARYVRYCRKGWTDPRQLDLLADASA